MRKYRLFLMALVISVLFSSQAFADIAYTVVDNTYSSGSMGLLYMNASGDAATQKEVVKNLNGDHGIFSFLNAGGHSRVMISQYTRGQSDTVWIYDRLLGWAAPVKEKKWDNFSNRRAVAASGNYIYAVDYDNANLVRVDMAGEKYNQDKYYKNTAPEGYESHGESVVATKGYIYGLFSAVKDPFRAADYKPGKLVKFDSNLNVVSSADVGKNACRMTVADGMIFVVSIGGKQNGGSFNEESKIEMVDADTMKVTELFNAKDTQAALKDWKYYFRDITVSASGEVYVLAGAYDAYWMSFESVIYKTSIADIKAKKLGTFFANPSDFGYTWELHYDETTQKLACLAGYQIKLYDSKDGTKEQVIGAQDLGGNLCSMTVVKKSVPVKPDMAFTSSDVKIAGVSIDKITISSDMTGLNGLSDYTAIVNGVGANDTIDFCKAIIVSIDHSKLGNASPVDFTVNNFAAEGIDGVIKVFIKKKGANKYDMFAANYDKTKKTLTYTIQPVGDYFTEGTMLLGVLKENKTPTPPSEDGSSGGCNSGFGALVLLTAAGLLPIFRKNHTIKK